jgi:hypothetical protein
VVKRYSSWALVTVLDNDTGLYHVQQLHLFFFKDFIDVVPGLSEGIRLID